MTLQAGFMVRRGLRRYFQRIQNVQGLSVQVEERQRLLSSTFYVMVAGDPGLVATVEKTIDEVLKIANQR
jgi:hypothetical protein